MVLRVVAKTTRADVLGVGFGREIDNSVEPCVRVGSVEFTLETADAAVREMGSGV